MFDPATLFAFGITCLVLAVVPGPNVTVIIATALARGPLAGLAVVAGTQVGILSMVFVVAFGFDALVGFMGWAFDWIKLFGAIYLVYLGFNMLRSSGKLAGATAENQDSLLKLAMRGFLVLWSNPKTLLFFGAFIPQFVTTGEPAFPQLMLLGLIFLAIASVTDSAYAMLAGSAGKAISQNRVKLLSRVSGSILMAGGVWLATQQKA